MDLMQLISGAFGGGTPAQQMAAPPEEATPTPAPQGGGLMSALGLDDPVRRAVLAHSLAAGLGSVKNSPFAVESLSHALGGSLAGGNKFESEQEARSDKRFEADRLNDYRQGTLGIAQQNANTTDRSRADTADIGRTNAETHRRSADSTAEYHRGMLDRGKFDWREGEGSDEAGQKVPGLYKINLVTGEKTFEPGATMRSRTGGGRDSVFSQALVVGNALYGKDTKEAAEYARGIRRPNEVELNSRAAAAAQRDLAANAGLTSRPQTDKDAFLRERIKFWKEQHQAAVPSRPPNATGRVGVGGADFNDPLRREPMASAPAATPAPAPEISMGGQGTQAAPYQPQTPEDYGEIEVGSYYLHPDGRLMRKK